MPVHFLVFFAISSLLVSLAALGVSIANYGRAGRWKESDDGKAIAASIVDMGTRITHLDREIVDRLNEHETRLTATETKLSNLATKADIAKLEADVRGLEKAVSNVDDGVTRIERFLMEKAR